MLADWLGYETGGKQKAAATPHTSSGKSLHRTPHPDLSRRVILKLLHVKASLDYPPAFICCSTSEEDYTRASAQSSGINRVCSLASSTDVSASKEMALGYECPVFARKFLKNTASVVYNLLKSCEHELCIANDGNCTDSIPEQSVRHNATSRVMLGMHEV